MTISATIIADSVSQDDHRLTTLELRYPRFIHAELMTHRVFSRNASSSRAIPVKRLIQDVIDDPVYPLHWGKNQPGMQADEEHDAFVDMGGHNHWDSRWLTREEAWDYARRQAIALAEPFAEAGYHKQIVNRLLEPFAHINVVLTATDFDNFFALRDHPAAQPEIQMLARTMKEVMRTSTPAFIDWHDWHLPYCTETELDVYTLGILRDVSAARCARVSYKTHDGATPQLGKDLLLAKDLLAHQHMSPFEHQATPAEGRHANLNGWKQYRKALEP